MAVGRTQDRIGREASGNQAEAAAGLEWRWGGGEKQLDPGVFWRLSVQDCSGVGYGRGRIKHKFGVELEEGAFSGLMRTGDSHVVRKGT